MTTTDSTLMLWNYNTAESVRNLSEINTILDRLMIILAEYGAYLIPPVLVVLFLMKSKHRKDSLFVFFVTILSIEISYIVSELYYHPRPFELYDTLLSRVPQNTFPSQHAATLFPFAFAFIHRNRMKLGFFFLLWAIINSFARIYVGFHFPLDILAGAIIGVTALLVLKHLENYVEQLSKWFDVKQDFIAQKLHSKARDIF